MTCNWCKDTGTVLDRVCGWCDGTTIQKPNFEGHEPRTCGEHRTVGPIRAWCYTCREWCYAEREAACAGCFESPKVEEVDPQ